MLIHIVFGGWCSATDSTCLQLDKWGNLRRYKSFHPNTLKNQLMRSSYEDPRNAITIHENRVQKPLKIETKLKNTTPDQTRRSVSL